ncbi:MAG: ATP-binding cassette domain-containing protein [Firmicutes bacterium]|nr:ATP-binding cassette domain-containing protein [Bacillota bacterium]
MSDTVIKVRNLIKSYGSITAVDSLDFEVYRAECFGLLGPNGAGKTTTMKILYGKAEASPNLDTVIDVFGCHPQRDALAIKAFSGIVPQQENLDTELNVTDNLLIYARFYGMKARDAHRRISELLDFMELQDKAWVKISELSGGMQRRLTIARALLNNPQLLILDEPTTGLDPQVRHLIWNKLRELQSTGVTILLTTHYMEEAFQICDRVLIMDEGRKILEGPPRQLLASHLEAFVMEIYGLTRAKVTASPLLEAPGIRQESFQDTLLVYSQEAEKLSELAKALDMSDYYIRQVNLEDLFLKVTGRGLNEMQ